MRVRIALRNFASRIAAAPGNAFAASKSAVTTFNLERRDDVRRLQAAAAIEPLPYRDPSPLDLRSLEWGDEEVQGDVDPAAVVRRLAERKLDPAGDNRLGCAYARLAHAQQHDAYWLLAIHHLRRATRSRHVREVAERNLGRVARVSGFPTHS